jgi:hypothetical protein
MIWLGIPQVRQVLSWSMAQEYSAYIKNIFSQYSDCIQLMLRCLSACRPVYFLLCIQAMASGQWIERFERMVRRRPRALFYIGVSFS